MQGCSPVIITHTKINLHREDYREDYRHTERITEKITEKITKLIRNSITEVKQTKRIQNFIQRDYKPKLLHLCRKEASDIVWVISQDSRVEGRVVGVVPIIDALKAGSIFTQSLQTPRKVTI